MLITIQVHGVWHAFDLARELEERGHLNKMVSKAGMHDVSDVSPEKVEKIPLDYVSGGLSRLPVLKSLKYDWYLDRLFEEIASRRIGDPDIFVGWSGTSLKSIKKAKEKGAVTVLERGSSHIKYQREVLKEEYNEFDVGLDERIIDRELKEYEEAGYIAVPSEFAKQTFIQNGIKESKVISVPLGADISEIDCREFDKILKDPDFLFVGGNGLRKGVRYLIEAWKNIDNESKLYLRTSFSNNSDNLFNIEYLENVSVIKDYIEDLSDLYSKADVLVLPSLEDGFGMVVTEAMASGMPVIVSENTGAKEIVKDGENGFIIPIKDDEAIREKIRYFQENPGEVKRMGKNARETAEKYTWDRYGEEIVEKYKQILAQEE